MPLDVAASWPGWGQSHSRSVENGTRPSAFKLLALSFGRACTIWVSNRLTGTGVTLVGVASLLWVIWRFARIAFPLHRINKRYNAGRASILIRARRQYVSMLRAVGFRITMSILPIRRGPCLVSLCHLAFCACRLAQCRQASIFGWSAYNVIRLTGSGVRDTEQPNRAYLVMGQKPRYLARHSGTALSIAPVPWPIAFPLHRIKC